MAGFGGWSLEETVTSSKVTADTTRKKKREDPNHQTHGQSLSNYVQISATNIPFEYVYFQLYWNYQVRLKMGKKSLQLCIWPWVQLWSSGVWENASGLASLETNILWRDTLIAKKAAAQAYGRHKWPWRWSASMRILSSRQTEETPGQGSSSRKNWCFTRYQSLAGYQPMNCWRMRPKTILSLCSTMRARRVSKHVFEHMRTKNIKMCETGVKTSVQTCV